VERQQKREQALRLKLRKHGVPGGGRRMWSAEDKELLGVLADDEVARRTGRTVEGVRVKRQKLGISNLVDRRRPRR
jgi:hypothetical protein